MLVVAGESLIDIVVDADGTTSEQVGGSPMNVAVGLARLDVPTILLTQTGADPRGERIRAHVRASEAELVSAPTRSGRTNVATARLDGHGHADYSFDLEWTLPHHQLPPCDALHVGSLGTALEPGRASVLDLVEQAYGSDVFVSLDPNVREAFLDDTDQAWRDLESLAERCTLVKLSDEDIERLHPGADPSDIARSLLSGERTEVVIVTRGGEGASAYVSTAEAHRAAPEVRLVDTVGAGDSFMAAALAILFEDGSMTTFGGGMTETETEAGLARLLDGAMTAASVTCSRRGANPPTRSELSAGWPN